MISSPDTTVKVVDSSSKLLAMAVYSISDDRLKVEILRISNYRNRYVLFNQIVNELTKETQNADKNCIEFSINELDDEMKSLLYSIYFQESDGKLYKRFKKGFIKIDDLDHGELPFKIEYLNSTDELSFQSRYEIERAIYPGKIDDLGIRNIIIPIKPYWASQLFDYNLASYSLFAANEKLIWNRNNVYYRSCRPNIKNEPCRILWYASWNEKYGNRCKGIIGCSYLENVVIGEASSVFKQFERLGTYDWSNIKDMVDGDHTKNIMAIEFSDTEVFKKIVPLQRIQDLLSKRHTFPGPLEISKEEFKLIYSENLRK